MRLILSPPGNAYSYALFIYAFDSLFIIRGCCLGKVFPLTPPVYDTLTFMFECWGQGVGRVYKNGEKDLQIQN